MKKIYYTLLSALLLATGCNKCYTCSGGLGKVCEGDPMYENAKSSAKHGTTFTDYNGQELYECK